MKHILLYEQFLLEKVGRKTSKDQMEGDILKTNKSRAIALGNKYFRDAFDVAEAKGKMPLPSPNLYDNLPDFPVNYNRLQKMIMDYNLVEKRIDMPVIEPTDQDMLKSKLLGGHIDVNPPYANETDPEDRFPFGMGNSLINTDFLNRGVKDGNFRDDVIDVIELEVAANDIKPVQKQIYLGNSLRSTATHGVYGTSKFLRGESPAGELNPLIMSGDDYIIDGHHRWAQAMLIDPFANQVIVNPKTGKEENLPVLVKVLKIDMGVADLLDMARSYSYAIGRNPKK